MTGFRWKIRRLRGGGRSVELRPQPRLREVTYDRFERVCIALGVDADLMFRGAVSITDIEQPPLSSAEVIFDLIVENAADYDLRAMAPDRVQALLGIVVADFFLRALMPGQSRPATGST